MKKVVIFLLIIMLVCFIPISYPEAKTLQDLYNQLSELKRKKAEAENGAKLSEDQINKLHSEIDTINQNIEQAGKDIIAAEDKIVKSEQEIETKEQEIKKIMNYVQVSSGESAYLEYIYGAQDFSDFIYRTAVAEQMVNYNKKLVQEYNDLIISLEKKKEDLAKKQVSLEKQKINLNDKIDTLRTQVDEYEEEGTSIEDDIKDLQEDIDYYKGQNCQLNDDLSTCVKNVYAKGWKYPLQRAIVTSEYSTNRGNIYSGGQLVASGAHRGIDLGGNPEGTPVYAAAPGEVARIVYKSSCGGNMVFIYHTVNGQKYTTVYMHMLSISSNIKRGMIVYTDTQIGTVGGRSTATRFGGYDRCTSGAHLHFGMATGWNAVGFNAHSFNPRNLIKFPGGYFTR